MIYYVFSVYDDKAEAFLPPFVLPKEAQALRLFSDCVNSESHQFGANPADYSLFRVGTWSDEDCQYVLERSIHNLGNGLVFVTRTQENETDAITTEYSDSKESDVTPIFASSSGENTAK